MKNFLIMGMLCLIAINGHAAWDGAIVGKINAIDVVPPNGENYGFRVSLEGGQALCGNEYTWAYINKSDDNYDAAVGVLLAAKMAGNEVVIYSNQGKNNYCHIGYIRLR